MPFGSFWHVWLGDKKNIVLDKLNESTPKGNKSVIGRVSQRIKLATTIDELPQSATVEKRPNPK